MLAQPTVTKHISVLEKETGRLIFDRSNRPIRLTPWGEEFVLLAQQLIEMSDSLTSQASRADMTRRITVAVTHMIVRRLLLPPLMAFRADNPHTRVSITGHPAYGVLRAVLAGDADIGIGIIPVDSSLYGLEYEHLIDMSWVLLTPKGHPFVGSPPDSLEEIAAHPLILPPPGRYGRNKIQAELHRLNLDYEIALEVAFADVIKDCVAGGLGLGILGDANILPEDAAQMTIIDIGHILPKDVLGIVRRSDYQLPSAARGFVDVVRSYAVLVEKEGIPS